MVGVAVLVVEFGFAVSSIVERIDKHSILMTIKAIQPGTRHTSVTSNPGCRLRDGNRRPHLHQAGFLRLALVELLGYLLQNRLVLPVGSSCFSVRSPRHSSGSRVVLDSRFWL